MATTTDQSTLFSPLPEVGDELPLRDERSRVLLELGACQWSGSLAPFEGHVSSPAPASLAEFEQGGRHWFGSVLGEDLQKVCKQIINVAQGGEAGSVEYRMATATGKIVWVRHWFFQGDAGARASGQVNGFVQVIDDRKQLESECIRISEYERQQIGQELHDDVCQLLAGLSCMLQRVESQVKTALPHLTPTLNSLVEQLNGGLERTRTLSHGLVPSRLPGVGLPIALEEVAQQAATSWGVDVQTQIARNLWAHPPEHILHLCRIAQEAIRNAVKHGKATKIELSLQRQGSGMRLTIQDNGCGLPDAANRSEGLGLHTMRYRAITLGGEISIQPGPAGGTLLTVDYPWATKSAQSQPLCA